MGGIDVTSAATVPADQRSVGTFGSRGHGVVAGLAVAAAAIDAVCGDDASDVEYLVADGDRVAPGDDVARVTAPTRAPAHRRAHGAQPAVPPVRRGHADPPLGRRPRRHRLRRARHAQDDARAAGAGEVRRALRRRGQPPHGARPTPPSSRTTTCSPPAASPRRSPPCARSQATIPVEIEVDSLDGLRVAIDAGADAVLLDNFDLDEHARRRRDPRRVGPARRARGERRPDAGGRPPGRRDRRRLRRRRRADPLGPGPRPRPRPARGQ